MKVTLLGTSSAEGWPGLFCRCEACDIARRLGGKNIRTRTTTLIDDVLKIDFPPDTLYHVIRYNLDLRRLKALLFTHAHDDHFSWAELQYRGHYFVPTPVTDPLHVYGPRDVIQCLAHHLDLDMIPLTLHRLMAWEPASIGDYTITPILAQHDPSQECFNYIIQDQNGSTLLYATDTGWYQETTWRFLENARFDGVVVECAKGPNVGGYTGHLSIPEVVAMRERLLRAGALRPDAPVVTTHFSHLGGLLHEELEAVLEPNGIAPGFDGMSITLRQQGPPGPASGKESLFSLAAL